MILAIDPGLTGALALLHGDQILSCWDMPIMQDGKRKALAAPLLADVVREAQDQAFIQGERLQAVMERVASRPGEGVSSAFSFGRSFGITEGVLSACGVPLRLVTPQSWKRHFHLIGSDKAESLTVALRLFPESSSLFSRKKDHGRADAALIGIYGGTL